MFSYKQILQERQKDEQTIRELHNKIIRAALEDNWKAIRPFVTDDYVFINSQGIQTVDEIDKMAALEEPKAGGGSPELEEDHQNARVRFVATM